MKKSLPLLLLFLLFPPQLATAQENLPPDQTEAADFWQPAQTLVQEQIYLVSQLEKAIASADPNVIKGVQSQLFLNTSAVDRLLRRYTASPNNLCRSVSLGRLANLRLLNYLTPEQLKLYCYLYISTSNLESLKPILSDRLVMLGDLEQIPDNLPPILPAIAISIEATNPLLTTRRLLSQATQIFPPGTKFTIPDSTEDPYAISPEENQLYKRFLSLPNRGITRILPPEFYQQDNKEIRSRLSASRLERFPYPPLAESGVFIPRLEISIDHGKFQIVQRELNYGFITDLGDIPLKKLDAKLTNISNQTRNFFLKYQPPDRLEALQIERRLFITGKIEELSGIKLFAQAPAILNHTYLVRTLQFQLPEIVLNNEQISKRQRRNLELLLATPSSDLLIAFRPVSRNPDGSYTVLWRILNHFPDPKINDLEHYVILD